MGLEFTQQKTWKIICPCGKEMVKDLDNTGVLECPDPYCWIIKDGKDVWVGSRIRSLTTLNNK